MREAILQVDGTLGRNLTASEQAQVSGTLGNSDTIQFTLPSGPQTISLTGGALNITRAVSIVGPGGGNLTISGNNLDRDFVVGQIFTRNVSLVASFSGLTIADGNKVYGGGLLNFGSVTVSDCTFANNTAGASGGGGIYNVGVLTLSNCIFTGNAAKPTGTGSTAGGAIYNNSTGAMTVNNCLFSGNTATGSGSSGSSGAGIANSGTLTITASTFANNTANSDGGGIYNNGNLTVVSSTFANNTALADGGGIRSGGTLSLTNCTFYANYASSIGGGLNGSDVNSTITNCTFTANRAGSGGAGLDNEGLTGTSPPQLFNTIVAGNFKGLTGTTASDIAGPIASSSANNLVGTGGSGGLVNGVNGNQVGVSNPGLASLADNGGPTKTVALLSGSPASDRGNNAYVTAGETDQRGLTRVVNGTVDIGAFEVQTVSTGAITSTAPADQSVTAGTATSFDLGSFSDTHTAAGPWSVDVNWGDGSSHTLFTVDATGLLPAQSHTYQTANNYTVTVKVTNANGDASQATFGALVSNPAGTPTVLTVNSTADNTTADSALTLREAILVVNGTLGRGLTSGEQAQVSGTLGNNDTIGFSLSSGPQTISLTGGPLTITRSVSIVGLGANNLTINGNGLDRVVVVGQIFKRDLSLVVAMTGLTISGGSAAYGGGLLNFGSLTAGNCTFTNNIAVNNGGGGIYNVGALTLNNCTLTGNSVNPSGASSSAGGAIYNNSAGTLTLNNCSFSGNNANGSGAIASSGGAVANSGVLTANVCTFANNTATSSGGAIYNNGTLTLASSTLANNTAGASGGGIRSSGTLTLTNCTLYGNYASSSGGALDSADVQATLTNCTITNNTTGSGGGGINVKGTAGTNPPKLFNTIVAGNFKGRGSNPKANDIAGSIDLTSAYNLIGAGGSGGLTNGVNNNQVGVTNIGLGALADNGGPTKTVALLSGSPAINRGSNAYVTAGETDQRGLTRIVNSAVDIGAFEVQS